MYTRLDRAHRAIPVALGIIALASVGMLLLCDANPSYFSASAPNVLRAFPLAVVAFAYLVYQSAHRPPPLELVKAILLAAAFLFWAANQFWPNLHHGTTLNDIAIALFALDVVLVIIGWPTSSPDESFAETYVKPENEPTHHDQRDRGDANLSMNPTPLSQLTDFSTISRWRLNFCRPEIVGRTTPCKNPLRRNLSPCTKVARGSVLGKIIVPRQCKTIPNTHLTEPHPDRRQPTSRCIHI